MTPTLTVVHNNIDNRSSIGAIAAWQVRSALERGWAVTAVCRDLDPGLVGSVEHRPLYVPPRLHLLQWSVARQTVRHALRGSRSDVLLVHQPQLAAIADIWNIHYLSRAARQVRGPVGPGLRPRIHDVQAAGVARLEDGYLSRLPATTRKLFCSETLLDQFNWLYGAPANAAVLHNPALGSVAPATQLPDPSLRAELTGGHPGPVVGFLGGGDPRKGGDILATAVAQDPALFLLHAGPGELNLNDRRLWGRWRSLGLIPDVTQVLDAVDVLVVPSRFEPFGMVVAEAAARGVPVVVSEQVGLCAEVQRTGAGVVWDPTEPLGPIVFELIANRAQYAAGGALLAAGLDPGTLADTLFAEIDAVRAAKAGRRS